MLGSARLHRVGDWAPRGRAAERLVVVPEPLEARAGVLEVLGGPVQVPASVDNGESEMFL